MMPRRDDSKSAPFVFICVMAVVFGLTYMGIRQFKPPLPKYYPVEKQWTAGAPPGKGPGMSWYAMLGVSLAVSAAAGAAATVAARAVNVGVAAEAFLFAAAVAVSLTMAVYTVWHEYCAWFVPK